MNHNIHFTTTNPGDPYALGSLRSRILCDELPAKGSEVLSMKAQASLWTPGNPGVACS